MVEESRVLVAIAFFGLTSALSTSWEFLCLESMRVISAIRHLAVHLMPGKLADRRRRSARCRELAKGNPNAKAVDERLDPDERSKRTGLY